jgi:phosphoribosylglycinamide formyltransferase-1
VSKVICVLISGSGSNLQALIDAIAEGKLDARIGLVISNNADAYGLTRARDAGIDTKVIDHRDYADRESFDNALQREIDASHCDLVVLAGFMRILSSFFVQHYLGRMLNIHPSLLPKYKGLNTHQRALEAGDTEHGVSVHFVTPDLDGGPVIIQSRVPIFKGDTADVLAQRVQYQEHQIYPLVVKWFCENRLRLTEQGVELDGHLLPVSGYASE